MKPGLNRGQEASGGSWEGLESLDEALSAMGPIDDVLMRAHRAKSQALFIVWVHKMATSPEWRAVASIATVYDSAHWSESDPPRMLRVEFKDGRVWEEKHSRFRRPEGLEGLMDGVLKPSKEAQKGLERLRSDLDEWVPEWGEVLEIQADRAGGGMRMDEASWREALFSEAERVEWEAQVLAKHAGLAPKRASSARRV